MNTSGNNKKSFGGHFNKDANLCFFSMPNLAHESGSTWVNLDSPTDLSVITNDGEILNVHRFILEAESSVYRKLIQEESSKDSYDGYIHIKDFNAYTFRTVLTWMYSGELQFSKKTLDAIKQVELAARKYRLVDMFGSIREEKRMMRNSHPFTPLNNGSIPSVLLRHRLSPPPPPPTTVVLSPNLKSE